MPSITELNDRFAIPEEAIVMAGNGGLPKVQITGSSASGEIYLHGAHVTSWQPEGAREVLFLSPHSLFQDGKAIRGGIPICFPWFGSKADDPQAPAHGFVRTKSWALEAVERQEGAISVVLCTQSDESTRKYWPHDFQLYYHVSFGRELLLELVLVNTGSMPLRFEDALHAYYRVGDATQASISGLNGVQYLDKTDNFHEKLQHGDVTITSETDRVYLNTESPLQLKDVLLERTITVTKEESRSTVIWNPWIEKAKALPDLGEDQWKSMLCLEVSNVGECAVELGRVQRHKLTARVSVRGE